MVRVSGSRGGRFVFGLIFTGIALFVLLGACVLPVFRSWTSGAWSATTGVVEWSTVEKTRRGWSPTIRYRYKVDQRDFVSERFAFWRYRGEHDWAKAVSNRFPLGASVEVFHDPTDPSNAVLTRDIDGQVVKFVWGSLLFLAIGCGLMIWNRPRASGAKKELT